MEWWTPEQRTSGFDERCRCEGFPLGGSDHCGQCFCEQFEERCQWDVPWRERSDSEKWSQALRRGR
jgi:hypothetical protein